jgi:hypothetical protein
MSQKEDEAEKAKQKQIAESIEQGKLSIDFLKGSATKKTTQITRFKKKEKPSSVSYRV